MSKIIVRIARAVRHGERWYQAIAQITENNETRILEALPARKYNSSACVDLDELKSKYGA